MPNRKMRGVGSEIVVMSVYEDVDDRLINTL
jgi:hypothetical protein